MQLKQAVVMWKNGNLSTAMPSMDEILSQLESLSASEPSGRGFTWQLATAWRLDAQMRKAAARKDAAVAIARAIELGEKLTREGRATSRVLGECALAHAVAAGIATHSDTTTAKLHWQRAWELVEPKIQKTRDWRLLDPAARAKLGLGNTAEAIAITKELDELGYVPVEPWPEEISLSTPQPQSR